MNRQQWAFFRDFLDGFWEILFLHDEISSSRQGRLHAWLQEPEAREYAQRLYAHKLVAIPKHQLRLRLKSLRETDGSSFDHIEVLFVGKN